MTTGTKETIQVTVGERGLLVEAKQLYSNQLDFLRELYQNGVDSRATNLTIQASRNRIVVSDNGNGMTQDFLRERFSELGAAIKGQGDMGRFGRGRFTYWTFLADEDKESESGVKYHGKITIFTSTGTEATKVDWYSINKYDIESIPLRPKGTTIIIELSESHVIGGRKLPSESEIIDRLQTVLIEPLIKVEVNGRVVTTNRDKGFSAAGKKEFYNSTEGYSTRYSEYSYMGFLSESTGGRLVIAENGLMVENCAGFTTRKGFGGVINFNTRATGKGITTMARDKCTLNDSEVAIAFAESVILPYCSRMSKREREEHFSDFVDLYGQMWRAMDYRDSNGKKSIVDEVAKLIVIEGSTIEDLKAKDVNWYREGNKEECAIAKKAQDVGYDVLLVSDQFASIAQRLGMKSVMDLEGKLKTKYVLLHPQEQAQVQVLSSLGSYQTILVDVMKNIPYIPSPVPGMEFKATYHPDLTNYPMTPSAKSKSKEYISEYIVKSGSGLQAGGVELFFAEVSDPLVVAFIDRENNIGFNLKNDFVQKALKMNKPVLLIPALIHENIHKNGHWEHDEGFSRAFGTALNYFNLEMARLEIAPKTVEDPKLLKLTKAIARRAETIAKKIEPQVAKKTTSLSSETNHYSLERQLDETEAREYPHTYRYRKSLTHKTLKALGNIGYRTVDNSLLRNYDSKDSKLDLAIYVAMLLPMFLIFLPFALLDDSIFNVVSNSDKRKNRAGLAKLKRGDPSIRHDSLSA